MQYVFDTNVFSQIFGSYYPSSFSPLRQVLEESLLEGRITSTREVLRELDNCRHNELKQWAKKRDYAFPAPTVDEAETVRQIFSIRHFQANVERKKLFSGMPNADCFVIARARTLGGTVVTLEKFTGSGVNIPDICDRLNVDCISLSEFMKTEKWVFLDALNVATDAPQDVETLDKSLSIQSKQERAPSPTLLILLILPLFGIFAALLIVFLAERDKPASIPAFAPAPPRTVINFRAPDFELPLLDGVTLVSPSDYAVRPLFLNFWATWCAPCVRELPALAEFAATHATNENGPALLTINLGETAEQITGFLEELGLRDIPVAMDINQVVKRDYGVQNLPTTFVIDSSGMIRHMKLGEMKYEEMGLYLQALDDES